METLKTKITNKLTCITKKGVSKKVIAYTFAFFFSANTPMQAGNTHALFLIDDQQITEAIITELDIRHNLSTESISVKSNNGIVSLTGTTNNILSKDRAEKIAMEVKGVRGVINQIQVETSGRTDQEIGKDIEKAMLLNPATDSYQVNANVTEGKATLTGKVDSWAESHLATMMAKGVKGVREVENNIQIAYKATRSDQEILSDIKQQLRFDIRVGDALIDVKVTNGEVSLSGIVGSVSEKTQAQFDAWVGGVKSVNTNDLKVDPNADYDALRKDKFIVKPDIELKDAVADALFFDPRVNSYKVVITAERGIVTLAGTVANLQAKKAAEMDARNVVGVMDVVNNITIGRQESTQQMLKENIDWALRVDPIVEKYQVNTVVSNGTVTLSGTVDSFYEKTHAEDVISQMAGVSEVKNNLQVKDTYSYLFWHDIDPVVVFQPKENDEEIKKDIKSQIWWSPFVDHEEVTVEVKNGKAILNGTVDSWSEEQSAIENAFEGGAVAVDSNLKIDNN